MYIANVLLPFVSAIITKKLVLGSSNLVGYNCCGYGGKYWTPICIPKGYDRSKLPDNVGNFTVQTNIVLATRNTSSLHYNELKNVDVNKMMLTYAPKIVISWIDPRLTFCYDSSMVLEKSFLPYLWIPEITVVNREKRETSSLDPGKISKI